MGVILFEMLTGRPPFNVNTLVDLMNKLGEKVELPNDLNLSAECTELVHSLLKSDSHQRISWDDFFNHPFFNSSLPATSPQQIPTGNFSIPTPYFSVDPMAGARRHTIHGGAPPMSLPVQSPSRSGSLPAFAPVTAPNSLPQHHVRNVPSPSLPDTAWPPRKPKTNPFKGMQFMSSFTRTYSVSESLEVTPLQDQVVLNDVRTICTLPM